MEWFPPRRVVAAADLSPPSLAALEAAKTLARWWRCPLEIVHVEEAPLQTAAEGPLFAVPEEERVRRLLLRAADGFPDDRLTVRSVRGSPPAALAESAASGGADLLVVGTHGHSGLARLAFGSVAEAVIRRARLPVLAVHEPRSIVRLEWVLAPWSGRPGSERALIYAWLLARSLGADLHVLHAAGTREAAAAAALTLPRRLRALLGASAGWLLRLRVGEAGEVIVREAATGRYGMAAVGARRRRFPCDLLRGSVVDRLLRGTTAPVLCVPAA
jgi:nucleotide-binding universal stress UspA family protein